MTREGAIDGAVEGFMWSSIFAFGSAFRSCFKAGTLVLTEDGHKPIEDVQIGDKVWSYDETTGRSDWKTVLQLYRNKTEEWCTVTVKTDTQTEEIVSTPGHKYYLPENTENRNPNEHHEHAGYENLSVKWVSAKDLKAGDKVLLSNGKYGIIETVETKHLDTPETTYNFEVEDYHTYYVGENGVLVHNRGPCFLNPQKIRYTQDNANSVFTKGPHAGQNVDDLVSALKAGIVTPDDVPIIKVFKYNGNVYSINNRRLYAFKTAGTKSVPVEWVSRSAMKHRWSGDGFNFYLRR